MSLNYYIDSVTPSGSEFLVSFTSEAPRVASIGIVLAYAKQEQKQSGRTCFNVVDAPGGMRFTPINTGGKSKKIREDLMVFIESIGFHPPTDASPPAVMRTPRAKKGMSVAGATA